MSISDILSLKNKKVVAIKGYKHRKNQKDIDVEYILFNDKETVLELEAQDFSCYHDCSSSARNLTIRKDKPLWKNIMERTDRYGDSNYCSF